MHLAATLGALGLTRSNADRCVFVGHAPSGAVDCVVAFHVDDIIVSAASVARHRDVSTHLLAHYRVTVMGECKWVVGIKVTRTPTSLTLSQVAYAAQIVSRFGLAEANPVDTHDPGKAGAS